MVLYVDFSEWLKLQGLGWVLFAIAKKSHPDVSMEKGIKNSESRHGNRVCL